MAKKPYYITTAITYASGKPHIGNTYEIVMANSKTKYKITKDKANTKRKKNIIMPKNHIQKKIHT